MAKAKAVQSIQGPLKFNEETNHFSIEGKELKHGCSLLVCIPVEGDD
jgi:hypothetical protein